ncbi:MAG: CsiV family protein [Acidiferrobacterales bacterium]|nr:CsiV family protein [Acidiferrobacterales bacterium]
MTVSYFLRVSFLTYAVLTFSAASAAPVHIEAIVFAHVNKASENPEWFLKPSEEIVVDESDQLSGLVEAPDLISNQAPRPVQSTELTGIANILNQHPNYTILSHLSWVQEPVRRSRTVAVSLDVEHEEFSLTPNLLLSGEIALYEVQLILQVEIDATYNPTQPVEKGLVKLDKPVLLYSKGTEYTLNEKRQVRIGELHYFDHPKFGVIFYMVRPR